MIEVDGLVKNYRVHKREPGIGHALRSLVRRRYETVKAVDGISFSIAPGERVGFLGPNGAGKTTTLKVLAGLLQPTAGRVQVSGFVPSERKVAFLSSIMLVTGQKQQLLWDLPPAETFELNRVIYDLPLTQYRQTLDELVTLLELAELIKKPTRQLSLGERMKCELAAALLHRPRVLFLDEPTIGLDVSMQVIVRDFIKTYNERHGASVILTSHYMDDVAALCRRVVVIDHGRLIYDGALEDLMGRSRREKRLTLRLSAPVTRDDLQDLGRVVGLEEGKAVLQVGYGELPRVISAALARLPISDLSAEDPPLEEVIAELFERGRAATSTGAC